MPIYSNVVRDRPGSRLNRGLDCNALHHNHLSDHQPVLRGAAALPVLCLPGRAVPGDGVDGASARSAVGMENGGRS